MNKDYFEVKYIKRKNKFRKIVTYKEDNSVRNQHEKIAYFLEKSTLPSKFSKAYIKKRSIISNARAHMYNDNFLMMDIKSFFNNIDHSRLIKALYYELNKEKSISKVDCAKIVELCSINKVGIPIGFVTSPILSNLYLKEFDNILYGKLKKYNLQNVIYTRYADDMTISFRGIDNVNDEVIVSIQELVVCLLKRYGLKLNSKKTKKIHLCNSNHVRITGINIIKNENDYRRLSVGNKRKNDLFWDAINYYETDQHLRNKQNLKKIKGMLSFILSVEKTEFEQSFSEGMKIKIKNLGSESLKDFIDKLE